MTLTGIAAINFTGNNSIAAGTLKSVIRTRETHLLSWLFRDDSFSEELLQKHVVLPLFKRGNRLSITPVSPAHWQFITGQLL